MVKMSRMEARVTKMEEDLAEMKDMLKSFFTKMEQRRDEEEQPIDVEKERKGQRVYQKRLDRDTLSQICWQGEFANYQKAWILSSRSSEADGAANGQRQDYRGDREAKVCANLL